MIYICLHIHIYLYIKVFAHQSISSSMLTTKLLCIVNKRSKTHKMQNGCVVGEQYYCTSVISQPSFSWSNTCLTQLKKQNKTKQNPPPKKKNTVVSWPKCKSINKYKLINLNIFNKLPALIKIHCTFYFFWHVTHIFIGRPLHHLQETFNELQWNVIINDHPCVMSSMIINFITGLKEVKFFTTSH